MASRYPDEYNEEEWEIEGNSETEFFSEMELNGGKQYKIIQVYNLYHILFSCIGIGDALGMLQGYLLLVFGLTLQLTLQLCSATASEAGSVAGKAEGGTVGAEGKVPHLGLNTFLKIILSKISYKVLSNEDSTTEILETQPTNKLTLVHEYPTHPLQICW